MKKFTSILASLLLSLGTLTAQEVYVTNLNDLSNEKVYLIESKRCFLMNYDGYANGLASNNANNCTATRNFEDQNQQFKIEKDGDSYYLYSVGAGKYVTSSGAWSDEKGTALVINNVSGDYPWHICIGNEGINTQIKGQYAQGLIVNSWTSADEGNCFRIVDIAASVQEIIDYPNELTEFDENKCYTATVKQRGGWAVNSEGQFVSYRQAGEVADANKQFAVLSADNENYYLFNIGANAFVKKDGTTIQGIADPIVLRDASAEGECRVLVQFKGYNDGYINLNGESNMDICSWSAVDHGNAVAFIEAGEFDPTEALAMLSNTVNITYNFTYGDKIMFTQTAIASSEGAYPSITQKFPYGVSANVPDGIVGNEDETIEIALNIEKALPFESATSVEGITKWYYVQMHMNSNVTSYIQDNNDGIVEWADKDFTASEIDSHLWGFVGDVWNGIKVVNKGTGNAITSTSGAAATGDAANATAFFIDNSQAANPACFCLKYPNNSNYLNAQGSAVASWGDNDNGSSFLLTEYKEFEATVSAVEYATLFLNYNAFIPEGVEVYAVNGTVSNYVTLAEVTGNIPANEGVILKNQGTYTFKTAPTAAAIDNMLEGTTTDAYITPENGTAYVLANGENGVGLFKAKLNQENNTAFLNNAYKAYLVIPNGEANPIASYSFNFDWEGTTGIEGVEAEGAQNGKIYDITGREVKAITAPGIYIVNGKKIVK